MEAKSSPRWQEEARGGLKEETLAEEKEGAAHRQCQLLSEAIDL